MSACTADDKFEIRTTKKPNNNRDIPNIYEQISCPNCGEENFWDSLN
jgi:cytochrome c-type biogenesis protein CcmH/NrfF